VEEPFVKLIDIQLEEEFLESECSLLFLQETATGHLSGESNPTPPQFYFSMLTLFFLLRLRLPSGLLSSGFKKKILYEFLISPARTVCSPI
jgi:hypothetical protein